MSAMLGMASKDERNQYRNGQAGDQTGQEVYIRPWYDRKPWNVVLRWKNRGMAIQFANVLRILCQCNKIGYDQNQRTTLWRECEKIGWNINRINEIAPCECDCSSLMAVCAKFCGLNVNKNITTWNLESAFRATGMVTSLRQDIYTKTDANLEVGDILLCTEHHVAAVVSTTNPINTGVNTPKKSIDEIAQEVIDGKWSSGPVREARLRAAGYDYKEVQAKVNAIIAQKSKPTKSTTEIAQEVIKGKWGSGATRKQKLEQAGYNYNIIQTEVNRIVKGNNLAAVAQEVIDGKWGTGEDRKNRLTKAGYNYTEVQNKVNDILKHR